MTGAAHAESPFKGGMKYTTMGNSAAKEKEETPPTPAEEAKAEPVTETPTDKVWKKYKALAAGEPEAAEPSEEAPEEKPLTKAPAPKPTGLSAIIDKYEQNKTRQSQMRVIQVAKPDKENPPESAQ